MYKLQELTLCTTHYRFESYLSKFHHHMCKDVQEANNGIP